MLDKTVNNLSSLLNSDFHRKLLNGSLISLRDTSNPLSFNNFCTNYRELVRHVLSNLAPDTEIKDCIWYTPDSTSKTGITRSHVITYVLQGGLPNDYVTDVLKIDILSNRKKLLNVIKNLSKYTHVNEDTFGIDASRASDEAILAIDELSNFLSFANQFRIQLARAIGHSIHEKVVLTAITETIDAIDELATHHSVDEIYLEEKTVTSISSKYIQLRTSGTIDVKLQWGSNGDLRRGDGMVTSNSFPFSCDLQSHVKSPNKLETIEGSFCVTTSSWWDHRDYDEA